MNRPSFRSILGEKNRVSQELSSEEEYIIYGDLKKQIRLNLNQALINHIKQVRLDLKNRGNVSPTVFA